MEIWKQFPHSNMNYIFDNGGIGDQVAYLPIMNYGIKRFPYITFYIWVPDFFCDFARNLLPEAIIRPFSKAKSKFKEEWPSRRPSFALAYSNLRTHLVDQAGHVLLNESVPLEAKNYLSFNGSRVHIDKFKLPEKYVVITTGFTAPVREMLPKYINEIALYVLEKGYTPVFLGKQQSDLGYEDKAIVGQFKKDEIRFDLGIDLVNKTSLMETATIISRARTIVGLDNGLLHIAGCTEVPIVGGFTTVDPIHRMPYRHNELGWNYYPVVPSDDEPEKFFQSRWDFLFDHDYTTAFLGDKSTLVKSVHSDLYIKQLEKIL